MRINMAVSDYCYFATPGDWRLISIIVHARTPALSHTRTLVRSDVRKQARDCVMRKCILFVCQIQYSCFVLKLLEGSLHGWMLCRNAIRLAALTI